MARTNERTDVITVLQVQEVEGRPLRGMRICVTGHLSKPRTEIFDLIQMAGGEVMDGVSYRTTHLVTNEDWTANSTKGKVSLKYAKARAQGCVILSEERLLTLIREGDRKARSE